MKVGTLDYEVKINGESVNEILVTSGKDWTYLDVSVTSKNSIVTKFALVYENISENAFRLPKIEYMNYQDSPSGIIKAGETKTIRLRMYNERGPYNWSLKLNVRGGFSNNEVDLLSLDKTIPVATTGYTESILNGADPVLSSNLIPVNISANGTVTKANVYEEWYRYGEKRWANAVVLTNSSSYVEGQVIPESNIQSYFVWIPRYKYQIFNTGNYTSLTSLSSTAVQTIDIVFENKNTTISNGSSVNTWLTHPAFTAFNSNGFWVGKFESGYKGAMSTTGAEQNNNSYSSLIIKPNVYSWRGITVGNAFKVSYDYLRSAESHMMKNTEWGAVAYLQHSNYGSKASVRVNNNNSHKTGYASVSEPTCANTNNSTSTSCNLNGTASSVTLPYNTTTGYLASTTGNITGVYDMSGGAWEYVMGYNVGASPVGGNSGITSLYSDFFTNSKWNKYYDKYTTLSPSEQYFKGRILGDATGEMGPFAIPTTADLDGNTGRQRGSWYGDIAHMSRQAIPFVRRGGRWENGNVAGIFAFHYYGGENHSSHTFRVVLTPQ